MCINCIKWHLFSFIVFTFTIFTKKMTHSLLWSVCSFFWKVYLRNSVQNKKLCFVKSLLHRWGELPTIEWTSKLFNYCFLHTLPVKAENLFFLFFFFHPWFYCCFVVQMRHLPCTIKVHILRLVVAPPRVDRTAEKTVLGVLKCSETVPEEPLKTRLGGFQDFHVLHPTVNQWKAWMRERETKEKAIRNHKNHDIGQVLLLGFEP